MQVRTHVIEWISDMIEQVDCADLAMWREQIRIIKFSVLNNEEEVSVSTCSGDELLRRETEATGLNRLVTYIPVDLADLPT